MTTTTTDISNPDDDDPYASVELDVDEVPTTETPHIEWGPRGPILYVYEPDREEPAYVLSLPGEADQDAELIQTPDWTAPDYDDYTASPSE